MSRTCGIMIVSEITLYNVLKAKLGESEAQTVVEGIKQEVKNQVEEQKDVLATKQDILRIELKIADTKVDIIKWVFAMFFALMLAIAGLYFKK